MELGAVALHLALDPAHRLSEEVLGLLQVLLLLRLLLRVLRSFAHFSSPLVFLGSYFPGFSLPMFQV